MDGSGVERAVTGTCPFCSSRITTAGNHFEPLEMAQEQRACQQCGQPFTPKRALQKFCKGKCRSAFHNAKVYQILQGAKMAATL
jgi:transcriptional regulator NrdR family protein